jgi:hypothetical protein
MHGSQVLKEFVVVTFRATSRREEFVHYGSYYLTVGAQRMSLDQNVLLALRLSLGSRIRRLQPLARTHAIPALVEATEMNRIAAAFLLAALSAAPAWCQTYLGNLGTNRYDANSTANPYGQYGSRYSPNSINNPYGQYGSPYSNRSATNPYATQAPKLYAPDGTYLGRASSNRYDPESISNPYGQYGSKFSPNSINNRFGTYGSPYSPQSPRNSYGSGVQIIGDDD